jgi:outer membrane protein assembly factor BamE (lipoprotein component of BamABCDE complex)
MKCAALLVLASLLILASMFACPSASRAQNSSEIVDGHLAREDKPSQFRVLS